MLQNARQHFAGCDRCIERCGERRMAFDIIGIERLFDPCQIIGLHETAETHSGGAIPLLVRINHHRHPAAEALMHRRDAFEIDSHIGLTDLDLDPTYARSNRALDIIENFLNRRRQEAT
ncbi:hypothetical protein D3C80_1234810 [compost metagenome]